MREKIVYREIRQGEEEAVCRLVMECFNEYVAPGYCQEGVDEFSRYVNPGLMRERLANNHFVIVALNGAEIAGVIEVRNYFHIALFDVDKDFQNQGIGRELMTLAISKCLKSRPDTATIEVNSSPYAVPIYEKLSFKKVKEEQVTNGIRYTPMEFKIDQYEIRGTHEK
jgi:ribosomal protein S18 acetylase RimI-like enzyme